MEDHDIGFTIVVALVVAIFMFLIGNLVGRSFADKTYRVTVPDDCEYITGGTGGSVYACEFPRGTPEPR